MIIEDLETRGLVSGCTDLDALKERVAKGKIGVWCGFDPTADSLHIGNLVGLMMLKRFADAGHETIALVGGATALVGDPSGRGSERELMNPLDIEINIEHIAAQISAICPEATILNNAQWTTEVKLLDFLRGVGKHIMVSSMLSRESVRSRLASDQGLSFAEFSYMLLQANDLAHLTDTRGFQLQIGGNDQWGNMTAGVELTRKMWGHQAFGLTWPLLVGEDGAKLGKSTDAKVWLSAHKTSPFQFFQYFLKTADTDVTQQLLWFTDMSLDEVDRLMNLHWESPQKRIAQRTLASNITATVHGFDAMLNARNVTRILFEGGDITDLTSADLVTVASEVGHMREDLNTSVSKAIFAANLVESRSAAQRIIKSGGVSLNGEKITEDCPLDANGRIHDKHVLIKRGKRDFVLVTQFGEEI